MKMFLETEVLVNGVQMEEEMFQNDELIYQIIHQQVEKMGLTDVDGFSFESADVETAERFVDFIKSFNNAIPFGLSSITNLCSFNVDGDLVRTQIL